MNTFFQALRKEEWPFVHGVMAWLAITAFGIGVIRLGLL